MEEPLIYALMFDNITVAKPYQKGEVTFFKLEENLPEFFIPRDLFYQKDEVHIYELIEWLADRVPPPQRVGIKKILKSLGLKEYDHFEIALKTRACLVEDGLWIAVTPEDSFRHNTIRGLFDFPELNIEDYK